MGKRGVGYLLNTLHLGGIGGQLAQAAVCVAKGAGAVNGTTVYEPCETGGMAAISVSGPSAPSRCCGGDRPTPTDRPPTAAAPSGVTAWNFSGTAAGTLYELNPATGAACHQLPIPAGLPHFSAPALVGGTVFLGTLDGVTAINGA